MATKYRAVLMVPTIIEFENEGSPKHVTEQVNRIASGMGKAESIVQHKVVYAPAVLECCRLTTERPPPRPPTNLDIHKEVA